MIYVKTDNPVRYSNAIGDRREQRKAKRPERIQKARNVWQVGKDTGLLGGIENLLLGNRGMAQDLGAQLPPSDVPLDTPRVGGWKGLKTWQKVAIIGGALAVAGGITYYVIKSKKA
jgi:hypothetical protein